MEEFNNEAFAALVSDLINDTFYTDNRSIRGRISTVRQYSEVIIRRILNISNSDFVTLGNNGIRKRIEDKSNKNPLLLNALQNIQHMGNKCTHTQEIQLLTENDLGSILDSLFFFVFILIY